MTVSAAALDAQIRALCETRAAMQPSHPAVPPDDPALVHHADNMLFHVRPAGRAVELALFHAGLGWVSVRLSRAQTEDLQDGIALAWQRVPEHLNQATTEQPPQ